MLLLLGGWSAVDQAHKVEKSNGVGLINKIFNNSDRAWQLKSIDWINNGKVKRVGSPEEFDLHDGRWHRLWNRSRYTTQSCGVPWYDNGNHYKALSLDQVNVLQIFQSNVGDKNWIYYVDEETGREIGRQQVSHNDFKCWMMIENDRIYLNVVNDSDRPVETLCQIYNEFQEWVKVLLPVLGKAVLGALGIPAIRQTKRSAVSPKKRSAVSPKKRSAVSPKKRSAVSPKKRSAVSPKKRSGASPKKRTGSVARP